MKKIHFPIQKKTIDSFNNVRRWSSTGSLIVATSAFCTRYIDSKLTESFGMSTEYTDQVVATAAVVTLGLFFPDMVEMYDRGEDKSPATKLAVAGAVAVGAGICAIMQGHTKSGAGAIYAGIVLGIKAVTAWSRPRGNI